jgi:hypothetical protein
MARTAFVMHFKAYTHTLLSPSAAKEGIQMDIIGRLGYIEVVLRNHSTHDFLDPVYVEDL